MAEETSNRKLLTANEIRKFMLEYRFKQIKDGGVKKVN